MSNETRKDIIGAVAVVAVLAALWIIGGIIEQSLLG